MVSDALGECREGQKCEEKFMVRMPREGTRDRP